MSQMEQIEKKRLNEDAEKNRFLREKFRGMASETIVIPDTVPEKGKLHEDKPKGKKIVWADEPDVF
jgi:hypothetical protein